MKLKLIIFSLLITFELTAQEKSFKQFEGYTFNVANRAIVPFAVVYNHNLQQGVLANENGYFQIPYKSIQDSITIKVIGFETYLLNLSKQQLTNSIYLKEKNQLLTIVTVDAKDNSYLFDYLIKIRKNVSTLNKQAKSYFYLNTFINQKQIELVECFYNAEIKGCDIDELHLKNGRFGIKYHQNNLFISVESAQALTMDKLFNENLYFPFNPLQLTKSKLRKSYRIKLVQKYINDQKDSTFVFKLRPIDTSGRYFYSKIWVNQKNNQLEKITLSCPHAIRHPFMPIHKSDSILNIDLSITKTFKNIANKSYFEHLDFNYHIRYKNELDSVYNINSIAVIQMYDFENLFILPLFSFQESGMGTYRKLNAFPFNEFFWMNHQELQMSDESKRNNAFYQDDEIVTNQTFFKSWIPNKSGFFEHPFIQWTGKRIFFRPNEQVFEPSKSKIIADRYNLEARPFIDYNYYKDSTHLLIKTIFDPFKSFYYLPLTPEVHCFINMYFDLMEINKAELATKIEESDKNPARIKLLYEEQLVKIESMEAQFFHEVQRGDNKKKLKEWNNYIIDKIGINNMDIFLNPDSKGFE